MAKRILGLVGALVFFGVFDAAAECVGCMYQDCTRSNGTVTQAARCDYVDIEYGYGINNCRNVFNCGGCMGWSCYREGEVPLSVLEPSDVQIERTPLRDAEGPDACEAPSR